MDLLVWKIKKWGDGSWLTDDVDEPQASTPSNFSSSLKSLLALNIV